MAWCIVRLIVIGRLVRLAWILAMIRIRSIATIIALARPGMNLRSGTIPHGAVFKTIVAATMIGTILVATAPALAACVGQMTDGDRLNRTMIRTMETVHGNTAVKNSVMIIMEIVDHRGLVENFIAPM